MRSALALGEDKRRPSSLGPVLWYRWIQLAHLEAETGDSRAAAAAIESFERDTAEAVARFAADDARRPFFVDPGKGLLAGIQLLEGSSEKALANATALIERDEKTAVPADDLSATVLKNNILRADLTTASQAAIRLGRYPEAEAFARKLVGVPDDPTVAADPRERTARAEVLLAHAIAMQGRGGEALAALAPALEYYRQQQNEGASDTWYRFGFAYALVVDALARSDNAAERAHRAASLDEATQVYEGASAEARQTASFRTLASLIASARG
jgi:tetratricopeptide (TPR) repeat protein